MVRLVNQMLLGLNYLHLQGVVHRDLKPENYLLESLQGTLDEAHLKLIDFGLARKFDPEKKMKTWAVTPYYVAPEILAKSGYTQSVDVWSPGIDYQREGQVMHVSGKRDSYLLRMPVFGCLIDTDLRI